MRAAVDLCTGEQPTHAVLWLHGLGADGHDFEPIVPELLRPGWPAIRFVFPHAPIRPVTINGGMPMRAWYDIRGTDIAARQDEAGIRHSIGLVEGWLTHFRQAGIAPRNCLIAGFSQGGAIALSAGLRHAHRLGGILALSTYLPLAHSLPAERAPANADLPVWMGHGSLDPIVPMALGEQSRDHLRAMGQPVTWRSYPMAHAVCAEEIADLAQVIGEAFGDSRDAGQPAR